MAIAIAGERSGVGKTTVTLALLAALKQWSDRVQSFKVGPDYIDPMFHQFITQRPCRNLDPVLTSEDYVIHCFHQHAASAEYSLVEGVMGLFDGVTGKDDYASTAHIARLLNLPILLVLNCRSTSRSIAAIAHGYTTFDPRLKFAGIVLNQVGSDRHLELLKDAIAPLHLPILGVLRRQDAIALPDRHLGLVPTDELPQLQTIVERLADLGKTCFDWEKLLPVLKEGGGGRQEAEQVASNTSEPRTPNPALNLFPFSPLAPPPLACPTSSPRLAIAHDRAFSFYYADNLDLLRQAGAELVEWSPLSDRNLPEAVQGLYFGGGFPEVFAAELSENQAARLSVQRAIEAGMPTYAECGGLMYLCDRIVDFEAIAHPMVGIFPTEARMGKRLTLGYRRAIAQHSTSLIAEGEIVWGHEFHRSDVIDQPEDPVFSMRNYDNTLQKTEGWQRFSVHASYLHLHFGGKPELIHRFLQQCVNYQISDFPKNSEI